MSQNKITAKIKGVKFDIIWRANWALTVVLGGVKIKGN
jgi:hypothetical protein